jgi:hypothetical protein
VCATVSRLRVASRHRLSIQYLGPQSFSMSAIDNAKDKAQTAKGQVKEVTGKATGDRSLEAEGKATRLSAT